MPSSRHRLSCFGVIPIDDEVAVSDPCRRAADIGRDGKRVDPSLPGAGVEAGRVFAVVAQPEPRKGDLATIDLNRYAIGAHDWLGRPRVLVMAPSSQCHPRGSLSCRS